MRTDKFPTNELWAVIPVKPLRRSKQRLRGCLGPLRERLTLAMLHDVLAALRGSDTLRGVAVVTLDQDIAELAAGKGARVVDEAGPFGMNRAIVQGCEYAKRAGATSLVVLPVDIPLLTAEEFDRLVHELRQRSAGIDGPVMGIVAAAGSGGTNWMCIGTDRPFSPLYGPDSYRRHLDQAEAQGYRPVTLESSLLSLDLDEESDLEAFSSFCRAHPEFQATRTWQFIEAHRRDFGASRAARSHEMEESKYA